MTHSLIVVCDDAGYACVDRGILHVVEQTQVPVCAEYLIEQPGAADRARDMSQVPLVSLGLHFELTDISDANRVHMAQELHAKGTTLGLQDDIRRKATDDAWRQLKVFREVLGTDPVHISTHGDFNVDLNERVLPWWLDLMNELFDGDVPHMQLSVPHVRHNLYSWNTLEKPHPPCEPKEFGKRLAAYAHAPLVEFVLHPAQPQEKDASLDMLFSADMRVADTEAAIRIIKSGTIEKEGFTIVPVTSLKRLVV